MCLRLRAGHFENKQQYNSSQRAKKCVYVSRHYVFFSILSVCFKVRCKQKFSSCVYIAANFASGALFLNLQKWLRAPRVIIY